MEDLVGRYRPLMRRLVGVLAGAVIAAGSLVTLGGSPAAALTTIAVTSSADSGIGSLRQTFVDASTGGSAQNDDVEIVIQAGLGTITLASSLPYDGGASTAHALTVRGNGATVQGNNTFTLIDSTSTGLLTIDGSTFTNGSTFGNGGAISASGAVTVTGSTFTTNTSGSAGGAIQASGAVTVIGSTFTGNTGGGGAIHAGSALVVSGSTFTGNNSTTNTSGGAIFAIGAATVTGSTFTANTASSSGGAIAALSAVTVTGSTFTGNTATGNSGGAILGNAAVTATGSTFTGNTAAGGSYGGAIYAFGPATVTNSTITGNTATGFGGAIFACSSVVLVYATVVSNTAVSGANIGCDATATLPLTSFGSVVALPQGGGANCAGLSVTTTQGFNFSDDISCGFTAGTDKQNAGDPGLGALADNGGPTQTRLPATGSPLIDAIPGVSCQAGGASGITTDQRMRVRPEQTSGACDIGAVEVQLPAAPVLVARFTG